MTPNRKQTCNDRQLPGTDKVYRRRELSGSFCLFAFLVFAAVMFGGCQSPLPPLPNPPGPKRAVRLSPGHVIKVAYPEQRVPDRTQKIRSVGQVSLPILGALAPS